jgi:hypothetical protein
MADSIAQDVAELRSRLVNTYMKGEAVDGSFENKKKDDQSGKKWKELMKMIANDETKDNVKAAIKVEDITLADNMKTAIDKIFESPETIKTIKLDNQTNEPRKNMSQCKMRIKSFFDMVRKEVGTNGFFLCQEDDYTTFGLTTEFFIAEERPTLFSGLKYIHAIKLGKDNAPITSATMIHEILSPCPSGLIVKDDTGKNIGNSAWGDGVTIFFGNDWTCESFIWSSGGNADTGILKTSFVPPADAPAPTATEVVSADAFIVGIFNNGANKIQIATTHLESGDTTKKGDGKDKIRASTITQIINLTGDIPTIYGFDGNSSAYNEHTLVVDKLKTKGFESAIEGHTIQNVMEYNENSHLMSSLKQRGWMTNQPWKPDPISYLIDYLVYKDGVRVKNKAKVPTGNATLMGEYALPSSWLKFNLPEPDKRGKIEEWKEWASDHIAVGAVFEVGDIQFKVTTLNALAIPLTTDGFSKGSKWPPESSAKAENGGEIPAAASDDGESTLFGKMFSGGKRTRRKRNRKTRRRRTRRGLSRHPAPHNPVMSEGRTQMPKRM